MKRYQGRISALLAGRLVAILLISLVVIPTLVSYRTWAQDNEHLVRLKSREFVPVPGVEPAVERQQQAALPGERIHALVQFWQVPSDAERVTLENAGVKLLAYVPENTWFVSMPAGPDLQSGVLAGARWMGAIQPEDRMAPTLRAGVIGPHATHDDGTVSLDLRFFTDVTNAEVVQIVARYNGGMESRAPEFHRFTVRLDPRAIDALANEDGVQWIAEAAPPKTVENDGSRARTNVDAVQAANLSGSGVDLGIWDGGTVDNHVDFSGRLTVVDSASVDDHATHVAGTMAGDGSNSANRGGSPLQWRGMAPGADIISYYWDNNLTDHNGAINIHGIELSQNSWGYVIGDWYFNCYLYGDYDYDSPDYDDIITGLYGKRISVIFAAGNERDDGDCGMSGMPPYINYTNVGPPATAKNIIAVGATNSNDDSMTSFSSWGPMDDGRIKPDVVAPGCESTGEGYIRSTLPGNVYGAPGWCGTSMAAPAVSGISGLIIEQYRATFGGADPLPSTVKALLIQTAVDLDDGSSYYNLGPDYASGYGRVDAQAAVDEVVAQHIREDQISHGQTDSFTVTVPAGAPSLKVTLAWDDEPGIVNANPALVNNLDLVLVEPDSNMTHRPWVLDPANPSNDATTGTDSVNNVEQVQVDSPTDGKWEVRIIGANVPVGPQPYSLVGQTFTTGGSGNVGPLEYNDHTIDDDNNDNSSGNDDGVVNPGETIELSVELLNAGTDEATNVYATISTSSPYVTFPSNTGLGYGNIPGGGTATNANDFEFAVNSSAPNGHVIHFGLNVTASNGGPWDDSFDVAVVGDGGGDSDPHEPNDTPADCTPIFFNVPITDPTIDPAGDCDYYCFTGSSGQTIAADVDAWVSGSPLNSVLTLLDSDGTTVLAENDDYPGHGLDPHLEHTLPHDSTFYLRVCGSGDGSPDYTYSVLLTEVIQVDAPWSDDMESGVNGWTADGFWHQVEDGVGPYPESHSPTHSWWYGQDATGDYDNGIANSGSLTSPAINIPGSAPGASLSFWSWYETETDIEYDQRWVQISVDGGPFQNLAQLSGDPMQTWVEHTFDLSPYVGNQVRIRFYFDTIDSFYNNYRGWYIDDFLFDVATVQPPGPIVYEGHVIDGDGIVNPGETIEMYVDLRNSGSTTANNVEACISEDSPYVNGFLYNDCSNYGDILGCDIATNTDAFVYSVSPSAPVGHVIHFTLDVTANNGGPWTTSFDVVVGQPPQQPGPVAYFDHVIDDDNTGQSVGNGDGQINPGETIELYVELLNAGLGTANAVNACLSEGSPHVDGFLSNDCSDYGDIPGGGTALNTNDFDFAVDSNAPHGHAIPFTITVTAVNTDTIWSDTFGLMVVGGGSHLYIEPPDQDVLCCNAPFFVDVVVDNVNDLGAFEFDLVYDPAIVHVEDVVLGPFLGSTGRSASGLGPVIDNVTGRTSYGAYSFGSGSGPSGGGIAATITLSPTATGESDLVLEDEQLTDTAAPPHIIPSTTSEGHVTVTETDCFFADLDCDGDVDIVDIVLVASRWGCVLGDDCYSPIYDMDNDADVDIADLGIAACYWGWPNGDFSMCYTPTAFDKEPPKGEEALQTLNVWIEPPDTVVDIGKEFTITVEITNANDLGAFEFDLNYDPNVVRVNDVILGDFLVSTGRTNVFELGPIVSTTGSTTETVSYGALTIWARPGENKPPGPDGSGTLVTITLETRAAGHSVLDLADNKHDLPDQVTVADIGGHQQSSTAQDGDVHVRAEQSGFIYLPIILKNH